MTQNPVTTLEKHFTVSPSACLSGSSVTIHIDKLEGLPAGRPGSRASHALKFPSQDSESHDIPLAPVACWPEEAHVVADLFPLRHVLLTKIIQRLPI